jgi:soluble P-type ATPase
MKEEDVAQPRSGDGMAGAPIEVAIPGRSTLVLRHLVLDLNGTLALDGRLIAGVSERVVALRERLGIHLVTAGTHGNPEACARELATRPHLVGTGEEKREYLRALGPEGVVAMGNGANDVLMFEEAALAIAVLGPEGLCTEALRAADVVVADPCAGLDLLLHPARLVATLRR